MESEKSRDVRENDFCNCCQRHKTTIIVGKHYNLLSGCWEPMGRVCEECLEMLLRRIKEAV